MQSIGLSQSLTQTTKLTPTQIQVIRMLELPSIELCQRINEELQENPALEEGPESAGEEGMNGIEGDEFDDNYMPDDGYDDGR
jgi:RNA polymerase sigma-54 factor